MLGRYTTPPACCIIPNWSRFVKGIAPHRVFNRLGIDRRMQHCYNQATPDQSDKDGSRGDSDQCLRLNDGQSGFESPQLWQEAR